MDYIITCQKTWNVLEKKYNLMSNKNILIIKTNTC